MSSGNPFCTVSLQHDGIWFSPVPRARGLYDHLTNVYHSVCARCQEDPLLHNIDKDPQPHAFRALVRDRIQPFEFWPRKLVARMAFQGPIPTSPHPTYTPQRHNHDKARSYMSLVRKSPQWITPVHADVWLRAILKMLPVNDRFKYTTCLVSRNDDFAPTTVVPTKQLPTRCTNAPPSPQSGQLTLLHGS
ncbi:unnamed protein product, partial [Aphanomyces euteiches]